MKAFLNPAPNPLFKAITCTLCLLLAFSGCAYNTVVQIKAPYAPKVRPGDGVKINTKDGTLHSGRVVYVDRSIVVIRTPKQTDVKHPVESARFGTTVRWDEVETVKVAGTLDSRGALISNEEIRVNRRTSQNRKLFVNIGLLGMTASFLAAVKFQDSISPASTDASFDSHGKGRAAFWSTFIGGTLASALVGYALGVRMDRKVAIQRIERQRAATVNAKLDSLREAIQLLPSGPAAP